VEGAQKCAMFIAVHYNRHRMAVPSVWHHCTVVWSCRVQISVLRPAVLSSAHRTTRQTPRWCLWRRSRPCIQFCLPCHVALYRRWDADSIVKQTNKTSSSDSFTLCQFSKYWLFRASCSPSLAVSVSRIPQLHILWFVKISEPSLGVGQRRRSAASVQEDETLGKALQRRFSVTTNRPLF
jgi:hypothetical protein